LEQHPPIEISDSTINGWLNRRAVPLGGKNERYLTAMIAFLQADARGKGGYEPGSKGTWAGLVTTTALPSCSGSST
jgi:hypothetical protein